MMFQAITGFPSNAPDGSMWQIWKGLRSL